MLKCQFCCNAGGVWPAIVYTQTDTEGETERGQSPEYILKSSKKTQYLMNTLYQKILISKNWIYYHGFSLV